MTSSTFLAQYGIAEQSLSPEVKDGINEVLRAGAKQAIEQLGQILQKEAQKRGIDTGTNTSTAAQEEAARIAKEEFDAQQAAAKKKKQQTILMYVAVGVTLLGVVIAIIITKKRKQHG
ncbi:hypothetical protein GO755_33500 [Spirosoma sp. HMF4905]|uniref:Uncharacterized protein n=1 Tax=Spirosoma arboris TaxID=2682092 RepID=A0A7K1SMG2_9BACT|nr:hypothetical protein [Spirosoma arboris]MVM34992.1 hypothetical protein [Spirosoma arboris]